MAPKFPKILKYRAKVDLIIKTLGNDLLKLLVIRKAKFILYSKLKVLNLLNESPIVCSGKESNDVAKQSQKVAVNIKLTNT